MVQMARHEWTSQALHLACAMARNQRISVSMIRMLPVQHAAWLGTELADPLLTHQEYQQVREYQRAAETYDVQWSLQSMQYITLGDALVEAATHLDAIAVFAALPQSKIPYLRKFQIWNLQHKMAAGHRMLYTLDQPNKSATWAPSITMPAHK